jgi:hypothetical protein
MSKRLQLLIPEPCHENWDIMKPTEKGRFCNSCKKQVVDFTTMNDLQLVAFFRKRASGSVCGRFMVHQLDKHMEIPKKRVPWLKYFFQFVIPAFLVSCKSATTGKLKEVSKFQTETVKDKRNRSDSDNSGKFIKSDQNTMGVILPEIITDSVIKKDIECLPQPIKEGVAIDNTPAVDGQVAVKIYEYKEIKNESKTSEILDDNFILRTIDENEVDTALKIFMGAIASEVLRTVDKRTTNERCETIFNGNDSSQVYTKESFLKKIFRKPSNVLSKVFPNPVKSGSYINIELKNQPADYYLLELLNVSGQLIFAKEIFLNENGKMLNVQLPRVSMGSYFIRVRNKHFQNANAVKITIE